MLQQEGVLVHLAVLGGTPCPRGARAVGRLRFGAKRRCSGRWAGGLFSDDAKTKKQGPFGIGIWAPQRPGTRRPAAGPLAPQSPQTRSTQAQRRGAGVSKYK
jgi:hypothetical protein